MKRKDDYSCIVFFDNIKPKKWKYVHRLGGFVSFLNQKHSGWKYVNVYNRRTNEYLKRFYPGNLVPDFLNLFLLALTFTFFAIGRPLNSTFSNAFQAVCTPLYGIYNTATISTHLKPKEVIL